MTDAKSSPAPWKLTWGPAKGAVIVDADGEPVAALLNPAKELADADGARIVEAVNGHDRRRDLVRLLADNLTRRHLIGDRERELLREVRKEVPQ